MSACAAGPHTPWIKPLRVCEAEARHPVTGMLLICTIAAHDGGTHLDYLDRLHFWTRDGQVNITPCTEPEEDQ